ncbi:MAG: hypothetical protein KJ787_04065 [Gammaproteobacteria bacterium]|nr:hypothetical protein [Gammaproteobacteria bacterium]MBU1645486.1 hypothetical protein [Gammaproteobacteria bacterium]MBU1971109.1 hypothetical protein [Gammaproteobacteria bacterium]
MKQAHPLLIPEGKFCYRIEVSAESIHPSSPAVGGQVREAKFGDREKMVLCPYWMRTEHGTVRCGYLSIEVEGMVSGDYELSTEHYGVEKTGTIEWSLLSDKIKVCQVKR